MDDSDMLRSSRLAHKSNILDHRGNSPAASEHPLLGLQAAEPFNTTKWEFAKSLRSKHAMKFDAQLHRIRNDTSEIFREAKQKDSEFTTFQTHRARSISNSAFKIPKKAILHRIETMHRAKFPSFSMSASLSRPFHPTREAAERLIDITLSRRTSREKQSFAIKASLSSSSRQILGYITPSENDSTTGEGNLEDSSTPFKYTKRIQRSQVNSQAKQADESKEQLPQEQPPKRSRLRKTNRHLHPCQPSYHDDGVIEQLCASARKSLNTTYTRMTAPRGQQLQQSINQNMLSSSEQRATSTWVMRSNGVSMSYPVKDDGLRSHSTHRSPNKEEEEEEEEQARRKTQIKFTRSMSLINSFVAVE